MPNNCARADASHSLARRLDGKVAVVTGGARGIGEAIVRLFVATGARVVIADVDLAAATKLSGELSPHAAPVRCDVTRESDVESAVSTAVELFGGLDIYVNNAGILSRHVSNSVAELDAEDFLNVQRVNVVGVALGMKHAARVMVPRKRGSIISMASVAGINGGMGTYSYTSSKHAVVGLTKNGAAELGRHGIRVNAISPFGVATRLSVNWLQAHGAAFADEEEGITRVEEEMEKISNLKGICLRVNDVAQAALFLASDDAAYVSGHNLVLDGGVTAIYNPPTA